MLGRKDHDEADQTSRTGRTTASADDDRSREDRARADASTSGSDEHRDHDRDHHHDEHRDGAGAGTAAGGTAAGTEPRHAAGTRAAGPVEEVRYEDRRRVLPAKTSVAATFALVFGLSALITALTALLAPVAVLFGLLGVGLGVAGLKMARRDGVTGKGVAIGGLVTAVLGLVLGLGVLAGAAVFVNDEQNLDRLQEWIDDARADLPTGSEVVEELPGS